MFPLVLKTITSTIYPPHPVGNHEVLQNPDTYAEDGPNGSSFDGCPDRPLNDRVGLWKDRLFGSTTLKTAISRGATHIADIRLSGPTSEATLIVPNR